MSNLGEYSQAPGFFISATVFYALNLVFPVHDMSQVDPVDLYGTFTEVEARRLGIAAAPEIQGTSIDGISIVEEGKGKQSDATTSEVTQ